MGLDDNTRSGLQYLVLGVLVVGLPTLIISVIDARQTAGMQATDLLALRNGYLLPDPWEWTLCSTTRIERFAWAFMISALVAIITGLTWRPRIAPIVGIACSAWLAYAAACLPPVRSRCEDHGLVITRRPVLLADLTLPWGQGVERIDLSAGASITIRPDPSGGTLFLLETPHGQTAFASAPIDGEQARRVAMRLQRAMHGWRSAGEGP